jgi:hypothetical protein
MSLFKKKSDRFFILGATEEDFFSRRRDWICKMILSSVGIVNDKQEKEMSYVRIKTEKGEIKLNEADVFLISYTAMKNMPTSVLYGLGKLCVKPTIEICVKPTIEIIESKS